MVQTAVDEFIQEGLEQGLEQGRTEGRKTVAANLLQEGMEPDQVAKLANLSQQQVEALRQKINGSP